uniref:histidine kinase n=1 Tax=Ammonifex degensii TaxID=42838 RepID=A0A7C1FD31_9THEO
MHATDVISKPITWEVLRHRVQRLLRLRNAEVLLQRSEARRVSLLNQTLEGIITVDEEGRIQSFNPAAERIFGYSAAEVTGKPIRMLMPGAYRQRECYLPRETYLGGDAPTSVTREITGYCKGGAVIPVEVTISGFYAGEQRLFIVRDISARKEAERRLRLAAKVFESILEGIVVAGMDGTVQSVNPAFTVMTGYTEEEIKGNTVAVLWSEELRASFSGKVWDWFRRSGHWQGEVQVRRKNGTTFPALLSLAAIGNGRDQPTECVVVLTDLSEQAKLREEQRRLQEHTAKLERLASLGTMSAGIAHEINQPLNVIRILTDGMLFWHKRERPLEPDKVIENLEKISAQISRIDEIIKHMRSFANIGRDMGKPEPVSLNDAVNGALGMLGRQLAVHGIVVRRMLAPGLPVVRGHTGRLEEIVVNLVVNAMQALDKVNRTEKEIVCRTWAEAGKVCLAVEDNGTGIDAALKERIFEPFFTTKPPGEGIGLGLCIVQSIVTRYGGRVTATNNARGGATFTVELPAVPQEENGGK